ncbi:MAG: hypothetical protein OQK73_11705 [Gammaproteobacteria bacterium]|nr:hypothetical protein [Gammaproteobacteria bacterium]
MTMAAILTKTLAIMLIAATGFHISNRHDHANHLLTTDHTIRLLH